MSVRNPKLLETSSICLPQRLALAGMSEERRRSKGEEWDFLIGRGWLKSCKSQLGLVKSDLVYHRGRPPLLLSKHHVKMWVHDMFYCSIWLVTSWSCSSSLLRLLLPNFPIVGLIKVFYSSILFYSSLWFPGSAQCCPPRCFNHGWIGADWSLGASTEIIVDRSFSTSEVYLHLSASIYIYQQVYLICVFWLI